MSDNVRIDGLFLSYNDTKLPLYVYIYDIAFDKDLKNRIEKYIDFIHNPEFFSLPLAHKVEELKKPNPDISSSDLELFSKIISTTSSFEWMYLNNELPQYNEEMKTVFLNNFQKLLGISNKQISAIRQLEESLTSLEACKDSDFVAVEKQKIEEKLSKKSTLLKLMKDLDTVRNLLDEAFPSEVAKKVNKNTL